MISLPAKPNLQVSPTPRPGDAHAEKRKPLRAGYVGHLTQVSNRLLQLAADGHEQVGCGGPGLRDGGLAWYVTILGSWRSERGCCLCTHATPLALLTPPACPARLCSCVPPWRATSAGSRM